jgi:hypothetical protein
MAAALVILSLAFLIVMAAALAAYATRPRRARRHEPRLR